METYKKYKQIFENYFEKYRVAIGLVLALFIIFSGTLLMIQGANAQKDSNVIKSTDVIQPSQTATDQTQNDKKTEEVVFDIEGAVVNPGVYRLPAGSVLVDAINKAGGLNIEADRDRIAKELNQASVIANNSKIYIFKNSDKDIKVVVNSPNQSYANSSTDSGTEQKTSAKININTAGLVELDSLPGIGPALGQRIIDWRDANGGFEVLEDIKKVKGIGDSLFEGIKDQIIIE